MAKGEWKRSGADDLQLSGRSECEVFDDGTNTFFWWVHTSYVIVYLLILLSVFL